MSKETIIDGLTNFSTTPDAIFSACGISIIVGLCYTLIHVAISLILTKRDGSKSEESDFQNEITKSQFDQYWFKSIVLSQMMLGAMHFVGEDKRHGVIGDIFGSRILGYHFAGLLLSMVIAYFVIIVINDTRSALRYMKRN